ncbi:MAG: ABC transporter permease [Gemmatimonadetes bacterium]|nr:ABC transporter permease [Gemmatimonadota bacterium]
MLTLATPGSTDRRPEPRAEVAIIEPTRFTVWSKLAELWRYRDLFFFFVWRDIKTRYAQSVLGVGWAVAQPFVTMVVFTVVFGKVAKISSDGRPYAIFSFCGLVPWTYFANTLSDASSSLVKNSAMLGKIYFPRMIMPLTPVLGRLLDFGIAFVMLLGLMLWFRTPPTPAAVLLPFLILMVALTASGLGMFLSALAVQYRDVTYAMGLVVQMLMYAAPVVYPASLVPEPYRMFYALNPMVGAIEGFRATLLGAVTMPWTLIAVSGASAVVILAAGAFYFTAKEPVFADVV